MAKKPKDEGVLSSEILPCELTQAEKIAKAEEMAALSVEITNDDIAETERKKAFRDAKADKESKRDKLAKQIHEGKEDRLVETRIVPGWEAGTIETFRQDTGELVRSREMTPQERQRDLNLVALGGD